MGRSVGHGGPGLGVVANVRVASAEDLVGGECGCGSGLEWVRGVVKGTHCLAMHVCLL